MGEFSEQRRGFSGQTLTVTKVGERELIYDGVRDKTVDLWTFGLLNRVLNRALQDPSFVHIRLIDEHGTTVFNRMQLHEVLPEIQRLVGFAASDDEASLLHDVLDLAQEVKSSVHTFLVFIGD